MKIRFVALTVLFAWVLAACGGDKPPMVPDPDNSAQADAGAD
jgi:hypothetical protein